MYFFAKSRYLADLLPRNSFAQQHNTPNGAVFRSLNDAEVHAAAREYPNLEIRIFPRVDTPAAALKACGGDPAALAKRMSAVSASAKRRAKHVPAPTQYLCVGGPFNGSPIWLQERQTAWFEASGMRGRYSGNDRFDTRGRYINDAHHTVLWEPETNCVRDCRAPT
jgi:hypothetical protein